MNAVDLIVEDERWEALRGKTALAEACVSVTSTHLDTVRPGVMAILLAGDDQLADLNQRFRDREGPTNVLSFPADISADNHLGDVALAYGVVAREADDRGISIDDHLRHLIIHGFLHLQGYDHQTDAEAEVMEGIERRALAQMGVADPYQDSLAGTGAEAGNETE